MVISISLRQMAVHMISLPQLDRLVMPMEQFKLIISIRISFSGSNLLIYVTPATNDITVSKGTFLSIEPTQVDINVVPVSINQ